jgi:PKD repeat protein
MANFYIMKSTKKFTLLLLLFLAGIAHSFAQQPYVVLSGHVTHQQTGLPVIGQAMYISSDSLNFPGYFNEVFTDESGFYTDNIPYSQGTAPAFVTVSTSDCNGVMIAMCAVILPGAQQTVLDFSICGTSGQGCSASFRYMHASNDMLTLSFTDESFAAPGAIIDSWFWDFGDGATSTDQNPVHKYAESGFYMTCLYISSSDSSCYSSFCLPVEAGSVTPGGCDNYFWYYPDSTGSGFTFEGWGINIEPDSYSWDFGDGTTATGQSVTHQFANPDSIYTVCLTTTGIGPDGTACTSISCQEVFYYIPSPCESSFWYYTDSTATAYTFEGWSFGGNPETWTWDFGDGTTATGQIVNHTFANPNEIYTVCLTTTGTESNGEPCTYTSCQEFYNYIPSPCESWFWYYPDSSGTGYTFEGWAMNNMIDSWTWDFGDGTTATGQVVSHSFANPNEIYTVCLTTAGIGPDGTTCTYTFCQEVYTYIPSPCENYFDAITNDGSTYQFNGFLLNGGAAEYLWNFGDGTTATGQQVTHTFQGGMGMIYNVCLTTVSLNPGDSCISVNCQTIFTGGGGSYCKASMSAYSDPGGYTWYFEDLSLGNHPYRLWDFGDGNQSTEANPVHTYAEPGIYMACLTISDSLNTCWDQTCQEIWVDLIQPECQASFFAYPVDSVQTLLTYQFVNTSFPEYTSAVWDFGDGTSSADPNPVHTYSEAGIYNVCLTIENGTECQSTYCMTVFAGSNAGENIISGVVIAGNLPVQAGMVWLIGADNYYYAEAMVNNEGSYNFGGVPAGSYYIYAMLTPEDPTFFEYLPTYYQNSLTWQGATIVTTNDTLGWYPVYLVSAANWGQGTASITGAINWSGNFKSGGMPAENVEIVLFNNTGLPIAYTFSHSDGSFEFNNLPFGEYTVHAEMVGKHTQVMVVILSDEFSSAIVNFEVSATAISALGRNDQNHPALDAGKIYPNPVGETIYLELNASVSGNIVADIIDLQGRIILSEKLSVSNGSTRITLNAGNLVKGAYLLRISADGYQPIQRKFIK